MQPNRFLKWLRRVLLALLALGLIGVLVAMWVFSSILETDLLRPAESEPTLDLEIATVGGGSVVFTRTDRTVQEGIWGLRGEDAYAQVSAVIDVRGEVVERGFRTIEGTFREGDRVRLDENAYTGTPLSAHGIGFEVVPVAGEFGVYPAWRVEAEGDTWVIVIHGKGSGPEQALRVIPALKDAGFPVLAITYRNDAGTPSARDGRYGWGREEWRDLDDAVNYAMLQGAEEIILYGFSMGGEIAATFLHESDLGGEVVGLVLDSPVLDLDSVVDAEAADRGIPRFLTVGAKGLASLRFDLDWSELDQVERADQFDVPILLMHGELDATVPVASSRAFAAARSDIVRYEEFAGVDHVSLWNMSPVRYETALLDFLLDVADPFE